MPARWSKGRTPEPRRTAGDVDGDLVEEPSIQALLDRVSTVDPNGLPGGGGFGLVHRAFDAVGHEVDRRAGSRPSGGDVVGKDECWPPSVISAPALRTAFGDRELSSGSVQLTIRVVGLTIQLFEQRDLESPRGIQAGVERIPRGKSGRCDQFCPGSK